MRFQGFVGPSYTLESVNYDCQRCINLYPQINEVGRGKDAEVASLVTTPGLLLRLEVGIGPIRGMHKASDGTVYVVSFNTIFKVDSNLETTEIGTLTTSEGFVSFADNGQAMMFVDGTNGYFTVLGSSEITTITDEDFYPADKVVYVDGYFIFNRSGTQQFFWSSLLGTDFDSLDFASAEGNPDNLVSIIVDHRDIWFLGTLSTEVWNTTGDVDLPFQRMQGAFIEHGCAAAFSVAKMNNSVFWLGQDDQGSGIVYMARGYQPQRISTHAVEYAIRGYENIDQANAYTYQDNGHFFYVLNFPTANTTWVYDMSTNMWHERCYTRNGSLDRHLAGYHVFAFGKHLVGDYRNGKIYELSNTHYYDDEQEITRQRVSPHISSGDTRIFYKSFKLDMETGVGLDGASSIQGHDPKVMLQYSDDGGHTFSNELWIAFGKIGKRKLRAIWRRLGQSRDRVFKITITEPVKVSITGAELDVETGAA